MSTRFFDHVDWGRPWLVPLRAAAAAVMRAPNWHEAANALADAQGLCNHRGLPIRFVPQASLPPDIAYEAFISATGCVPTRENLHDFFNALVWLTFPRIKTQLNALQAAEIGKVIAAAQDARVFGRRGSVRDAATIFDENAALLVVRDPELADALRAHRWQEAFITHRQAFESNCEVWLFGHALMEKLVMPYKAITAHAWPVIAEATLFDMSFDDTRAWIDSNVAQTLQAGLKTADFSPLPILGIPGWWEGQDCAFYADAAVFRPKRQA